MSKYITAKVYYPKLEETLNNMADDGYKVVHISQIIFDGIQFVIVGEWIDEKI